MMDQRLPRGLDHLQEAMWIATKLGLAPDAAGLEQRAQSVLQRISELEPTKTTIISSTLSQAAFFDELARQQVARAELAGQHLAFAQSLEDLRPLLAPLEYPASRDGQGDPWQPATDRMAAAQSAYEPVAAASLQELEREQNVQEAYRIFRAALKESEATALELLEAAFAGYNSARQKLLEGDGPEQGDPAVLLDRLRELQDAERRWGVARDVANRAVSAAAAADIVLGRLAQSAAGKERLYWQSQGFLGGLSAMLEACPRALGDELAPEARSAIVREMCVAVELFQERTRQAADEVERLAAEAEDEIAGLAADSEQRLERLTPPRG